MTKDKDEKAVIRARMERTGESYAAARAQLARGSEQAAGHDSPRSGGSLTTTPAAGRAIQAAAGQSAWHLVVSLRAGEGVASRVLGWLGFPAGISTPPVGPDGRAASSLQAALLAALEIKGADSQVDTGILLRGAVDVLDQAEVPPQHSPLVALLRSADLVGLCAAARRDLGPETDDRAGSGEGLFTRFTDRARVAIVGAQEEARALDHGYIGTEHLLLGVLREGGGVGFQVLAARGVQLEAMRGQVVDVIGLGDEQATGHIPFTPRAKSVLELAVTVSIELQTGYVGTEHLLIAMVEEGVGVAAQILSAVGCTADVVRADVVALLATLRDPNERPL